MESAVRHWCTRCEHRLATDDSLDGLHVVDLGLLAEHVLVQTPRKVGVEQEAVHHGLAHNAADEAEITHVVGVDAGVGIRLEGTPILCRHEQSVVGVEHLLCEDREELSRQPSGVDALLVDERDVQTPSKLVRVSMDERVEGVFEHVLPAKVEAEAAMTTTR